MAYNPNNPNGSATSANSAPVVIASDQAAIATTSASLPLPAGAATAANQATSNTSLSTIATNSGTQATAANQTNASQKSQIVDGSGNVIGSTLVGGVQRLGVTLAAGAVPGAAVPNYTDVIGGTDGTNARQISVDTTGKLNINNISGTVSLPTGAATSANQATEITSLSTIATNTGNIPTVGQKAAASSLPVTFSNENVQDLYVIGQSAQTATVSNILTVASGAAATDATGYRSATVQVVSTGTAGTFIFEGSNDNVNFQTIPVFNQLILTGTPITAAITATATQLIYTFPIQSRYVRLRIATTITGGSIQAFTKMSQTNFTPAILQVAQGTAANLATTATIASGTVTTVSTVTAVTAVASVTSSQSAIPGIIADVASSALTTTTTTATLTPTFGCAYTVTIPVTVVSGTTPTLDVEIQESDDTGTNWVAVYDFPRITATGFYRSPLLTFTGNRIRYVQTVSGTTPSFTRAINRLQSSVSPYSMLRQIIDRSIVLTTLNSTTPNLTASGSGRMQMSINIGATTIAPILQMEGSDDNGSTWYSIGTPLTAVASSTVSMIVVDTTALMVRARVSTAGTGTTAGYVLVKAF